MSGARSVEVRFLRHPLACSWRSLSTYVTTTAVALSLYTRVRRTRSSFRRSLLVVFSLALRLSFETRFVSAGALLSTLPVLPLCISSLPALSLCSRLCRRSALDSAGGALLSSLLPESLVHISICQNQFDVLLLIRRAWAGVLYGTKCLPIFGG